MNGIHTDMDVETLQDHAIDGDTQMATNLAYPEYSALKDGSEGAFLPQIGGCDGAKRVYRAW
jgi:hypothetical protein